MKKIKEIVFVIVIVLAGMLICSYRLYGENKTSGNEVRIATMTTGFTVALHYAQKNGIYDDLGLETEEIYFESGPSINEAIASGDVDIAGIGEMPSVTGALANNSKIVAWMEDDEASIQAYARNDSDIVRAGKGNLKDYPNIYGTAETWKGKDILCAKGTSSHFGLLATLNALGLKEEDVNIINMEGSAGAAAFTSGTADIFFGFDPQWAGMFDDDEEYTCISTCGAAGESLMCVLIASEDFVKNRPEDLVKVLQGLLMAEEELGADQETYVEEMFNWQSTFGGSSKELAAFSAELKPFRSRDSQLELFEEDENGVTKMHESLSTVADFMVENNLIEKSDKEKLFSLNPVCTEYFKEAVSKLE